MGDTTPVFVLSVLQHYQWTGDKLQLGSFVEPVRAALAWQESRAQGEGLPLNLQCTYDWFRFHEQNLTAYNSVLHLAMLAAVQEVGRILDEPDLVSRAAALRPSAVAAVHKWLWNGRFLRAFASLDGARAGAPPADALHVDSLYGQLWALQLGLGLLLPSDMLIQHLRSEHTLASSEFGLLVMSNFSGNGMRIIGRDNMVWEAGSISWSGLALHLRAAALADIPPLLPAETVAAKYLDMLKDPWDWKDITAGPGTGRLADCSRSRVPVDVDGQPFCNSHYSRQVWIWTSILALTRQRWDAASRSLTLTFSGPPPAGASTGGREGGWGGVGGGGGGGEAPGSAVLPVVISGAFLHWYPREQLLACAAGTMRVQRVTVVEGGAVAHGNAVLTQCVGRWEVTGGGALSLQTCQLAAAPRQGRGRVD